MDLSLALVSHTNAGKTTLARTLLGADVGEVRDAPHVTAAASAHELLRSAEGDRLWLWDTPGFGDSARLVRRLRQARQPLGWLLAQVWDRLADPGFWHGQQAARAVREHADAVLYLVNAAERPEAAGYVVPEMELLAWMQRPVIVLLNQMGAPRPPADEAADVQRWRDHLSRWPAVRAVLPLDAFARCWVQEGVLLEAVAAALGGE
jgi:predicted GTPase